MTRKSPTPASTADRVVITGIGMLASTGHDRESLWRAVRAGRSGVRRLRGVAGIPNDMLLGAQVNLPTDWRQGLKVTTLCQRAAEEALRDARFAWDEVDRDRFGCAVSAHMGDLDWVVERCGRHELLVPEKPPWQKQWLPNSTCHKVAERWGLYGPRFCHSTACASGLIDIQAAIRAIQDGQCDIALAGSGEEIHPLFAAGFHQMKVLAHHENPRLACRPFDVERNGFVMGEGAAMLVVERLDHALARNAKIYSEVVSYRSLADAHHMTGLDEQSETLAYLIEGTLDRGRLSPRDIAYINAHGTGTVQNDLMEARGIRRAFGRAAGGVWVSSIKAMLGHLVNAAGSVELAITALALRDGFAPPTMNLLHPDPECALDCVPLEGRRLKFDHALKISVAFGGHLAAVLLRRWNDAKSGFAYPREPLAA